MGTLLNAVHSLASITLRASGFQWETRHAGEVKVGLWRKRWRRPKKAPQPPRRLVIVPGFGDTPLSWMTVTTLLQPLLRKRFDELVFLDFPGYCGFLAYEKAFPSYAFMTATVDAILASLRPQCLIGHSLGGRLSAEYAIRRFTKVEGQSQLTGAEELQDLILVDPAGVFGEDQTQEDWEVFFRGVLQEGFAKLKPTLFAKEPRWFKWIEKEFSGFLLNQEITQFMSSLQGNLGIENELHKILTKCWVLWGEKDQLIPVSNSIPWMRALASSGNRPLGYSLLGVGHSPQVESPFATALLLSKILRGHPPFHGRSSRIWKKMEKSWYRELLAESD